MRARKLWNELVCRFLPRYQIIRPVTPVNTHRPYRLYLYNNWHNGDVIFSRPLYQQLIASNLFDLVLGVYKNRAYLLEDFVAQGGTLHISPICDRGKGQTGDLVYMCPPTHTAIHTWLGQYPDTHPHTWHSTVTMFNRRVHEKGIDFQIPYHPEQ